jgi:N-acetylmuramoyl-L-alanine amidase
MMSVKDAALKQTGSIGRLAAVLVLFAVVSTPSALAQQATVTVTVDVSGSTTRLVLTHSRAIVSAIREGEERLEVVYSEPVLAEPASGVVEDAILTRFELGRENTLVFHTGPGYRGYESFELRNPFRLIIDLQGSRPGEFIEQVQSTERDPSKIIIVIDPGHGGVEEGAEGPTGVLEKNITLDLSRRLKQKLDGDPSINVVLTRDEDRLVGLDERTAIANHNQADLFVSIHLNASTRSKATGAETYFLSADATDDEARTLAALENRAFGVDQQSIVTSDDQRRGLDLVLWDLAQNQYIAQSSLLAESVQRHMNQLTGIRDRGVRQAPFRVLMGATMPAILVEVGFITNPAEETRIKSMAYRNRIVDALASAVYDFLRDLERVSQPGRSGSSATGGP